tara:strand:+ start:90 stop:413 length:324 start_codon:yes stop_codon:yes gene_type:complete
MLNKSLERVLHKKKKKVKYNSMLRIFILSVNVILLFALGYYFFAPLYGTEKDKRNFKTYENALYYTTITHFTVGLGDIAPESTFLRRITMLQVVISFYLLKGAWKSS